MIISCSRWLSLSLLGLSLSVFVAPSHAGLFDKIKDKVDGATKKVTDKTNDANTRVNGATGKVMAPVVGAQQKVMAPVVGAQGKMTSAQMSVQALRSKLMGAELSTDRLFSSNAQLRAYKLDSMVSPNGQALRLTGTVRDAAARTRAGQIAATQFPGRIINEIRVVPATAKANVQNSVRGMSNSVKAPVKVLKNPFH